MHEITKEIRHIEITSIKLFVSSLFVPFRLISSIFLLCVTQWFRLCYFIVHVCHCWKHKMLSIKQIAIYANCVNLSFITNYQHLTKSGSQCLIPLMVQTQVAYFLHQVHMHGKIWMGCTIIMAISLQEMSH